MRKLIRPLLIVVVLASFALVGCSPPTASVQSFTATPKPSSAVSDVVRTIYQEHEPNLVSYTGVVVRVDITTYSTYLANPSSIDLLLVFEDGYMLVIRRVAGTTKIVGPTLGHKVAIWVNTKHHWLDRDYRTTIRIDVLE